MPASALGLMHVLLCIGGPAPSIGPVARAAVSYRQDPRLVTCVSHTHDFSRRTSVLCHKLVYVLEKAMDYITTCRFVGERASGCCRHHELPSSPLVIVRGKKERTNPRRPSDPFPSRYPALAGGRGGHHWTGLALPWSDERVVHSTSPLGLPRGAAGGSDSSEELLAKLPVELPACSC